MAFSQGQSCPSMAKVRQSLISIQGPKGTGITLQDPPTSGTFGMKDPRGIPSTPQGYKLSCRSHTSGRKGAQRRYIRGPQVSCCCKPPHSTREMLRSESWVPSSSTETQATSFLTLYTENKATCCRAVIRVVSACHHHGAAART